MKTLAWGLVLATALSALTGCAPDDKVRIDVSPAKPDPDENSKPTPLSTSDRAFLAFDELLKIRRSVQYAVQRPDQDETKDGCITFQKQAGSEFLLATYACKRIIRAPGDGRAGLVAAILGAESFTSSTDFSSVTASGEFKVQTITMSVPPRTIQDFKQKREVKMTLGEEPGEDSVMYNVTATSAYRAKSDTDYVKNERWALTVKGAFVKAGAGDIRMLRNSKITLDYYAPGAAKDAPPSSTLTIFSDTDIDFMKTCPRAQGAFRWSLDEGTKNQKGSWNLTPTGIGDSATGDVRPWPQRCGEN